MQLTPWDTLYHAPSSSPRRRRSHYLPYIDHRDWSRHTVRSVSELRCKWFRICFHLPWTFLIYSDHRPCRPSCEHCRNANGLMSVKSVVRSWCIIIIEKDEEVLYFNLVPVDRWYKGPLTGRKWMSNEWFVLSKVALWMGVRMIYVVVSSSSNSQWSGTARDEGLKQAGRPLLIYHNY